MDNGQISSPQENEDSQKFANDLNLALSLPAGELEKSENLSVGFDEASDTWELIVKYNGDIMGAVEKLSGTAVPLIGGYAVVTVPAGVLGQLSGLAEVEYVEMPHRLYFGVSQANQRSCVVPAWNPPYGLSGTGCIVAVIDSGIDWKHPDFRREDGTTRILKLWDQTVAPERSGKTPPKGYASGSEYGSEDINEALAGNKEALESLNLSRDYSGHGTFVAGVAAGNGRSSSTVNRGVAYDSSLIIVKLGESAGDSFPRTTRLMEAVNYVILEAQRLGRPVAVNLSFGNNQGSHDGSGLLSSYLDAASKVWKTVICCGTGNEAGAGNHAFGRLENGRPQTVEFSVGEYEPSFYLQLWKNYSDEAGIELITPSGEVIGPLVPKGGQYVYNAGGTTIYVYYGEPSPYSIYQQIYFEFVPKNSYISPGLWTLRLVPERIVDGNYDLWLPENSAINEDTRFLLPSEDTTLTVPSAADSVVSVGAYNSRTDAYADFSGRGYTRTNDRIKPDIVAPGVNITSTAVGGGYTMRTGTSMATPFAAGAAALLMEWGIIKGNDPYLYGEKVKAYLIRGARPLPGEPVPSKKTGWGALCLADSIPE